MTLRCSITVALLLIASCLSLPSATLSFPGIDTDHFSCPTGFIPVDDFGGPNALGRCVVDKCYGNPGPCGAGNTCTAKATTISGFTVLESVCTCSAPSVVSHIVYEDFCYVPGTDRCNPNPCKNGGTCAAATDFNGNKGAFGCTCPPDLQGTTCELPYPSPNVTLKNGPAPPTPPPTPPPTNEPITGDQGRCGKPGEAFGFPKRCYFNNDPQGRYVCCDNQGCDGFNADNLTPHCKNYGHVPVNFGLPVPTIGDQGLCGQTGEAKNFPTRCWFNNDPLGRYVCCDEEGCNGFRFEDNFTPNCRFAGYVPPNFGLPTSPGPGPAGGNQGVCGSGAAAAFPKRCWYNNDPQGRYVCCDNDGCDGFNSPGNFFPKCKSNGYVPQNL